ncbi:hypothetical protein MKW94_003426, partial [Papaver nudicaule]|nr:hypothetical protein [Papaver nudicaule]
MAWFRGFPWVRSVNWSHRSEKRDGYDLADHVESDQLSVANVRVFKSRELVVATDKYNPGRVLGEGGSGRVYKGILEDGQEVAVKRFHAQEDLWAEAQMLSCIEHSNIVKMIGYCDKGKDHIIVYEYMPLRSLNLHLHDLQPGKEPLDWKTRMKIAGGVAKALEYLHNQKDPPVISAGLNTTGILLDGNYNPKLSGFGYAKHGPIWHDNSEDAVVIKLPLGYIAPEYLMTGALTLKSDIYGFGVILLELISGRKAIDFTSVTGECNIVSW